jgi:hypothetical protein
LLLNGKEKITSSPQSVARSPQKPFRFGCGERTVNVGGAVWSIDRGEGGAMAKPGPEREEITVILPPEPPELNPEAARVLLRILLKA